MTCQNCGHPQERHPAIWYGSQRGRPLTSCDDCPCTAYREPELGYHPATCYVPEPAGIVCPSCGKGWEGWNDGHLQPGLWTLNCPDCGSFRLEIPEPPPGDRCGVCFRPTGPDHSCFHPEPAELVEDDDMGDATPMTGEAAVQYRPVIEDARIRSVHIVPEGEGTGHLEAVADLPDAVVEAAAEGIGHDSDCSDVRTPSGLCTCGSVGTARAALAAASGPWAEHLDAANADHESQRDNQGRWIFGKGPACRFIAATAWPFEAKENRDAWAPRIGDEPEFGANELAAAYRRLDEAAESVGLTPALAAALARNAELEKQMGWETRLMAATESDLETVEGRAAYQAVREEVHRLDTERLERAAHQVEALRAELDNLRESLAQKILALDGEMFHSCMQTAAAIVRGSDDE